MAGPCPKIRLRFFERQIVVVHHQYAAWRGLFCPFKSESHICFTCRLGEAVHHGKNFPDANNKKTQTV